MKALNLPLFILAAALILFSCKSAPVKQPKNASNRSETAASGKAGQARNLSEGLAEEIRTLTETGILSSMVQALDIIQDRDISGVEFGRIMNGINTIIIRLVYPDSMVRLPAVDLPSTHQYTRIIREAERGNYLNPSEDSTDFFEYLLPFFALNKETQDTVYKNALSDLKKAGEMRPGSVLPVLFTALIYERTGQAAAAETEFKKAYEISNECYSALTGIARVMRISGRKSEAVSLFSDLVVRYPDGLGIKRQLAITLYENGDWPKAGPLVDEILRSEPRDRDFLLMKAHILIEQGHYAQAQPPLDTYAAINPNNRFYLLLRARVQAEGNRNRDSALNYLRSIFRTNPDDEEALIYAASMLLESQRSADQAEGREYLQHLQKIAGSSILVQSLSLRDAVIRESWQEAQSFLNRILPVRRSIQDLIDAYYVEKGLGNNARAFAFARELYEKDTSNNEYLAIYISALIDSGRKDEASRLLETRLASSGSGPAKSRYYYLRSRIHSNEETTLGDLRSSLFEDPRNLQALIAMFEIYHRRREERRAVYYLKQALAIAPDNPQLKRYEKDYAALLNPR